MATLAANGAYGLDQGMLGATVAAWSALTLVGPCELLMVIISIARLYKV